VSARLRFGLLGSPVAHSRSPTLYNTLFSRHGINAEYTAHALDPQGEAGVLDTVHSLGWSGANLTVPFKEAALAEVDRLSVEAKRAGAVNVITLEGGVSTGHNTDGWGFLAALQAADGPELDGLCALIWGAGGAARAVASAMLDAGADQVVLLNRTRARAEAVAATLGQLYGGGRVDGQPLSADVFFSLALEAKLVVNCTAAGGHEAVSTLPIAALGTDAHWVDLNYWMADPPLEAEAAAAGVRFHSGLGMLAYQGAMAYSLFTGKTADGAEALEILGAEP
jgi:shikimate dehydrogenase